MDDHRSRFHVKCLLRHAEPKVMNIIQRIMTLAKSVAEIPILKLAACAKSFQVGIWGKLHGATRVESWRRCRDSIERSLMEGGIYDES